MRRYICRIVFCFYFRIGAKGKIRVYLNNCKHDYSHELRGRRRRRKRGYINVWRHNSSRSNFLRVHEYMKSQISFLSINSSTVSVSLSRTSLSRQHHHHLQQQLSSSSNSSNSSGIGTSVTCTNNNNSITNTRKQHHLQRPSTETEEAPVARIIDSTTLY